MLRISRTNIGPVGLWWYTVDRWMLFGLDSDFSIFELGMNRLGEISYLSDLVQPHVALINNVGSAHIGYFQSKKDIKKAKIEIIEGITPNGKLIINDDINLNTHHKKNLEKKNIEILRFFIQIRSWPLILYVIQVEI